MENIAVNPAAERSEDGRLNCARVSEAAGPALLNGARPVTPLPETVVQEAKRRRAREERTLYQGAEYTARYCIDCGLEFLTGRAEMEWFWNHDMILPLRCPVCRGRRRAARRAHPVAIMGYDRPLDGRRREGVIFHG